MSMQSNIGAETAAGEILELVEQKMAENKDKPEIIEVLKAIKTKVTEIQSSAKAGWY